MVVVALAAAGDSSCGCCRDNNIDDSDLELYFTCDSETLGKYESFDLAPGGSEIVVSESNKQEYLGYDFAPDLWFKYHCHVDNE